MKKFFSFAFILILIVSSVVFLKPVSAESTSFRGVTITILNTDKIEDYELRLDTYNFPTEVYLSTSPWLEGGIYAIKHVIISDGITRIGANMFYGLYNVESVVLPKSVTSIGDNAFWGTVTISYDYSCKKLKDVYYGGSISDRAKISVGIGNEHLLNAIWHYSDESNSDITLMKEADGKWHYYPNGQRSKKKTATLTNHKGKWFYVENGVWNTEYTGLFKYKNKWFYIKDGKWDSSTETLTKYNGKWFYIKNGKWDSSITTLFKYKGKTFYIKNGKWDSTVTKLIKHNSKLCYVKSGKLCKDTTFFEYKDKLYYIKNGIATLNFSGKITLKNGKLV